MRLCASADVMEGEAKRFCVPALGAIAVYRVDGAVFATADLCTHGAASLSEGWLEGHVIECPAHMGTFDIRTGAAGAFPATINVATFPVFERDGAIQLVKAESAL